VQDVVDCVQSRVTFMLLVVSIAWILLTTPYAVFTFCVPNFSADARTRATQKLVYNVCFLMMYVNHAVNFFLYCVTGRKFRVELREMLVSICSRGSAARRRWISTSPSMRTTRSNCVELEPLNNEAAGGSQRTSAGAGGGGGGGTRHSTGARRHFFVGEPANEVVVVTPPPREPDDDP